MSDMIPGEPVAHAVGATRTRGETVVFVVIESKLAGFISVADPVKATTAEAIAALHHDGVRVVMLTGDTRTNANAVARAIGIEPHAVEGSQSRRESRNSARPRDAQG